MLKVCTYKCYGFCCKIKYIIIIIIMFENSECRLTPCPRCISKCFVSTYLTKFIAGANSLYTKLTVNEWTSKVASGGQVKASLCGGCTVHSSTKTRSKCKNENLHDNVHGKVPHLLLSSQGSRRFSFGLSCCTGAKKSPHPKGAFTQEKTEL